MEHPHRQKLIQFIERIEDETLLKQVYDLLYAKSQQQEGEIWKNLSSAQREETLLNLRESENPENLVSNEEVKKRHEEKWL